MPRFAPALIAVLALALAGPALAKEKKRPPPPPPGPDSSAHAAPIVAAERAFAADGLAMGVKRSFLKHSAEDAVVFQPNPIGAHQSLSRQKDDAGGPPLQWWPLWAGVARSGDLGFTSGPFSVGGKPEGHYFTVWAKQEDGGFKWIFDGGVGASAAGQPGPQGPVVFLPLATAEAGSAAAARAEVLMAEDQLNRHASVALKAAYLAVLAHDGRIQGSAAPPATTPEAVEAELDTRPGTARLVTLGARASGAGDMAFTYGSARWTRDGVPREGHYARIWQKRAEPEPGGREPGPPAWKLVFDEIIAKPR